MSGSLVISFLGLLVSLVLVLGVKTEQRLLLLPWQVHSSIMIFNLPWQVHSSIIILNLPWQAHSSIIIIQFTLAGT